MMYKIMILEDEIWISTLIKTFIQHNFNNLEIIGEYQNGCDALDALETHTPDIALVDINVPLLNGLEVIAAAKMRNISCKFVIITGYKDFEYVHQALKSGVADYLLKPIEESELCHVLQKITSALNEEQLQKDVFFKSSSLLHLHFLKRLALLLLCDDSQPWDYTQYGLDFQGDIFGCMIIKITHQQLNCLLPHTLDDFLTEFHRQFVIYLTPLCHDSFFHHQGTQIIVIMNPLESTMAQIIPASTKLFETLLNFAQKNNLNLTAGLGSFYSVGIRGLAKSYQEAGLSLQARLTLGANRIIAYGKDITLSREAQNYHLAPAEIHELSKGIHARDEQALSRWLFRIFDGFQKQANLSENETLEVLPLVNIIADCFCQELNQLNALTLKKNLLLDPLNVCATITDLRQELQTQMTHLLAAVFSKLDENTTNTSILQACQYIEEHLQDTLTLETVASQVYLNSNYLCDLFKAETGTNFKDYVTEKRMSRACELLKTSQKITEIAHQVGYRDAKHFSKSFKKFTGISPKEYQRIHT